MDEGVAGTEMGLVVESSGGMTEPAMMMVTILRLSPEQGFIHQVVGGRK